MRSSVEELRYPFHNSLRIEATMFGLARSACFFLVVLTTLMAHAQNESRSRMKFKPPSVETLPPDDIDDIITNKQMRASSGSKSKYSIASAFNYNGGRISSPFSSERPNIAGATGTTDVANATGSVSVKYSLTSRQSLLAGIGVRWITPFQGGGTPTGYSGSKFDASNPYLNYQYIYKFLGLQSVAQVSTTYYTQSDLTAQGFVANISISQNTVYDFGGSRFSLGASAYTGRGFYNKDDAVSRKMQSDYSWGFSPFIEYQISDLVNFHSGWSLYIFEHRRDQPDPNTYTWDAVTQNLGFGFAVGRDIFLYPNIQFAPDYISADRTVVSLSANLNLF